MFIGGSKREQAQFDEALDPLYLLALWGAVGAFTTALSIHLFIKHKVNWQPDYMGLWEV